MEIEVEKVGLNVSVADQENSPCCSCFCAWFVPLVSLALWLCTCPKGKPLSKSGRTAGAPAEEADVADSCLSMVCSPCTLQRRVAGDSKGGGKIIPDGVFLQTAMRHFFFSLSFPSFLAGILPAGCSFLSFQRGDLLWGRGRFFQGHCKAIENTEQKAAASEEEGLLLALPAQDQLRFFSGAAVRPQDQSLGGQEATQNLARAPASGSRSVARAPTHLCASTTPASWVRSWGEQKSG